MDDEATLTDLLNKLDIPAEMSQMTLINGETCPPEEQWRSNKKLEEGQVVASISSSGRRLVPYSSEPRTQFDQIL